MKPDFTATTWTPQNALAFALLSELAYSPNSACKSWCERMDCVSSAEDTQFFVASDADGIVVAFRGSSSIQDFLTDAKIKMSAQPVGQIHEGFAVALDAAWPELTRVICNHRDNNQPIWFCGHSLGGALATLAAARNAVEAISVQVAGIYTFGSPRVGDKMFTAKFDAAFPGISFRHVNNADIVPRVPTRLHGYWHVSEPVVADFDGDWQHGLPWWKGLLDRVCSELIAWKSGGKLAVTRDHHVSEYVRVARQNCPVKI